VSSVVEYLLKQFGPFIIEYIIDLILKKIKEAEAQKVDAPKKVEEKPVNLRRGNHFGNHSL
jgi:hypothetical protein